MISTNIGDKKLKAIITFRLNACSASSGNPVGPLLGQYGIPIIPFCNEFNKRTESYNSDVELCTVIKLYSDNNYTFYIKEPSLSFLLKRASKLKEGYKIKNIDTLDINDLKMITDKLNNSRGLTKYQLYEVVSAYLSRVDLKSFEIENNNIDFFKIKKRLCLQSIGIMKSMNIDMIEY